MRLHEHYLISKSFCPTLQTLLRKRFAVRISLPKYFTYINRRNPNSSFPVCRSRSRTGIQDGRRFGGNVPRKFLSGKSVPGATTGR